MPSIPGQFSWRLVAVLLLVVAGAIVFLRLRTPDPSDPVAQLARANPGLKVAASDGSRIQVSSADGADQAFMRATDAGAYDARLTSCEAVRVRLPAWFRFPDDAKPTACLEVTTDGGSVQVLNFTTGLEIPALWDEFYEPMVEAQGLGYHGGSASGHSRGGIHDPRGLSYGIDGPDGTDNALSIDAFYLSDRTLAVVTLRRRTS